MVGTADNDEFVGDSQEYSQVDLHGSKSDYIFTENQDGSLTSTSDEYGTDTYIDIDGIWFTENEMWSSTDGLAY